MAVHLAQQPGIIHMNPPDSISLSSLWPFIVSMILGLWPPSFGALSQCLGYLSVPCCVWVMNSLGYFLEDVPFAMQTPWGLNSMPHVPCTILAFTMLCSIGPFSWDGISATMALSMSSGSILHARLQPKQNVGMGQSSLLKRSWIKPSLRLTKGAIL